MIVDAEAVTVEVVGFKVTVAVDALAVTVEVM